MMLIHGFMGSSADWVDADGVPLFSGERHVVAIDLPGHGGTVVTGSDESFRMENCAAGLIGLMDTLGLDRCDLVGYSMGGRLALFLALEYPQRFRRVVLESASPGLKTLDERKARIAHDEKLARRLETRPLKDSLTDWFDQPLFASMISSREKFDALLQRRLENDVSGLCLSLRMMGTGVQPSLWTRLDRLSLPLLLIVGGKDTKFQTIGRDMVARGKGVTMEVVDDAGHNVHFERPATYAKCVERFLNA
ncbi:MAG: 2-succinyl-6-hydroxy-2,4-cyclohexadiene-1-carboxylate synthase [candidate division Zixibacteria bacterium]|nr:2-succinyl-6-hydroxy-2,4-cyclohexadiene-1-carboxylate synthase [candidate division Zixibacteria bacterium]